VKASKFVVNELPVAQFVIFIPFAFPCLEARQKHENKSNPTKLLPRHALALVVNPNHNCSRDNAARGQRDPFIKHGQNPTQKSITPFNKGLNFHAPESSRIRPSRSTLLARLETMAGRAWRGAKREHRPYGGAIRLL
jgi:hypothetical protein